jgi:hypothetical protein
MKKFPFLLLISAALVIGSCSRKVPDFVGRIPDDAFLVVSMHPKKIFDKGQISSLDGLKKKIRKEVVRSLVEDPVSSGIMMDEYAYMFIYFKNEEPMGGVIAGLDNKGKFESTLKKLRENEPEFIQSGDFTMLIQEDNELMMAWDDEKVLFLSSPEIEMSLDDWQDEVTLLFNQPKEEAITSMVDFNDFHKNMKDMNAWISSDDLRTVLKKSGALRDMEIDLPVELYNNYGHVYCEFTNEGVFVTSETHLSEEVEKNTGFIIAKPELNEALLQNTPGGNLLMAMAFSMDIEKAKKILGQMAPPEIDSLGNRITDMTGIESKELWNSLTGDFVLAINGVEESGTLPVELFIGAGVNGDLLQEKLMGTVDNLVDVQKGEDFFMINANGIEIYSGILDGIWVITNKKGYKDAVRGKGLDRTLADSKFSDYAGGAIGMYMNLDMTTYPAAIRQMAAQNEEVENMLELASGAFTSLGLQAGNSTSELELITASKDQNSLYTILRMIEKMELNK